MEKVTLVAGLDQSNWVSCKSILTNISESYDRLERNGQISTRIVRPKKGSTKYELLDVAKEIYHDNPNKIVFIDHDSSLLKLLYALLYYYGKSPKPQIVIHVYGDFIIQVKDWTNAEAWLKEFNVRFVASSTKQQELVNKCLNKKQCQDVIPFPLSFDKFYFDENIRTQEREELGIYDDEYVFVYTGRLSDQKNDHQLVDSFLATKEKFNLNARLLLAGPFDDIGVPYLGYKKYDGGHFYDFKELLKKYPGSKGRDVVYLGNLGTKKLNALLNASDCFVSVSAHNDEDYGMAVAEAGATGLNMILTDWGGYHDLGNIYPENTSFIPLEFHLRAKPKASHLSKSFILKTSLPTSFEQRKRNSKKSREYNSIEKVSEEIGELLKKDFFPFEGFSETFYRVQATMQGRPEAPFKTWEGGVMNLYMKLYGNYGCIDFKDS